MLIHTAEIFPHRTASGRMEYFTSVDSKTADYSSVRINTKNLKNSACLVAFFYTVV